MLLAILAELCALADLVAVARACKALKAAVYQGADVLASSAAAAAAAGSVAEGGCGDVGLRLRVTCPFRLARVFNLRPALARCVTDLEITGQPPPQIGGRWYVCLRAVGAALPNLRRCVVQSRTGVPGKLLA